MKKMKRIKLLFIGFTLLGMACNALNQPLPLFATPTATLADIAPDSNCPDPQPTQDDIDFALGFNNEHFKSAGWKMSYTVTEYRVTVTWKNDDLGAVANFDHVIFCGATSASLDQYYTSDTFDIIFQNYSEHELEKDCRSRNNLRLYEFKVKSQGFDYNARFWVEIVDNDHTRETLLVFPIADSTNMDTYSKKLMSTLPSCE
jgi:hypothetical protein